MSTGEAEASLYTEIDQDNIAWLHFNAPGSSTNVLSAAILEAFYEQLLDVESRSPRGLVILSDKANGFIAGADVREFVRLENRAQALEAIQRGQAVLDRLAALPFPTVALIHGFCLGGGLELALACRYRVARDDDATRLGLPEVRLGIHPGFGGSARLTTLVGAVHAMDLMLSGRTVDARAARRVGLVDHALPERHLKTAARALVLEPPFPHRPTRLQALGNHTWVRPLLAKLFYRRVAAKAPLEYYPAPHRLIDLWQQHADQQRGMMHAEAESVADLIVGPTAHNLIRVFLLQEQLKALARDVPFHASQVHVIGAGTMGGDIAAWCALCGMRVTLADQSPERIAPAIKRAYALFERRLKRPRRIQEAMDRLMPDHKGLGAAHADVIIEAVFEDVEVKRSLFRDLEARARPDAILATNTSSILLRDIGAALERPSRLVGLHFFNPVASMQLIEVVRDSDSDPQVVANAIRFTRQIDRLPLPVTSTPGFLVNRILMPYLLEAVELENAGVPQAEIDAQSVRFGMPMGPIELADTVGLDICLHVAEILGQHVDVSGPQRLRDLVSQGRLGRKAGEGFYRYRKGKPLKPALPKGYRSDPEVADRMVLRMLNEAVACLREDVVEGPDHLDAGMVFGTGFAPFRGGPLRYIESVGADTLLQRLRALELRLGSRFKPDAGWEVVSGFATQETSKQ